MVKQKDKKGSRFFDLFRKGKGKKSKTKHSDEKPEEKEQEHELPDQQPHEPNDGNATSDLDEGFRESQDGSKESDEQLPTKLEKADFIPQINKGRTSDNF